MKFYPENQFAQVPNEFLEFHRTRIASELEEKFIALAVVDMQAKHNSLKASGQPADWDYISQNTISFTQFSQTMGVTNNTLHIRHSVQDLKSLNLGIKYRQWNEKTKQMHTKTDYISIFRIFTIDDTGTEISYQFEPYFQQFFTSIGRHFQLSIAEIVALNSIHSIRLYSLLKSRLNMTQKIHRFTIEELKTYLSIEGKYQDYYDFKRFVLDISKAQINAAASSKFQMEYTEVKYKRKVIAIDIEIISLGEKYYDITKKIPKYKKNQEYKRYKKLKEHDSQLIGDLATRIVLFADEHGFNMEQQLLQYYVAAIEKEIEKFNNQPLNTQS